MNKEEFYNELLKLAPSEYGKSEHEFPKHLKMQFDKYVELLDDLEEPEKEVLDNFKMTWDEIKGKINVLISKIIETINLYYKGYHYEAFSKIKEQIEDIVNKSLASMCSCNNTNSFYRMRVFKGNEERYPKSMFHIPFNMRTKVTTQRYSAPGYPCLYLGKSVYVCWEEMQRPHLDECYVSKFQLQESITMLNLVLPDIKLWTDETTEIYKKCSKETFLYDLLRFPLVIACMVKVAKPEDPFKPEYIIPQLLMEWLIEENKPQKGIMGIAYTSVHKSHDFKFPQAKLTNYVIPAFLPATKDDDYSKELCSLFHVTKPTCDELERAKRPYHLNWEWEDMESDEEREHNYQISTFGHLEKRLDDFQPVSIVDIPQEQEF